MDRNPSSIVTSNLRPYIRDRGPARHFQGRWDHRSHFASVLFAAAEDPQNGTAFLIQGAPGAGKTALLHQMSVEAKKTGWSVVRVKAEAFENPAYMAQTLGKRFYDGLTKEIEADAKLVRSRKAGHIAPIQSVTGVLRKHIGRRKQVLLVLDEAQHLADPSSAVGATSIRSALSDLTDGDTHRNIVLLMGGLGNTWSALKDRGLSRLARKCRRHLNRLGPDNARRVVEGWLGDAQCPREHLSVWIHLLFDASDGWPQHIICSVAVAADHFAVHGYAPSPAAMESVTRAINKEKDEYYSARISGIPTGDIALLGILTKACGIGNEYPESELLDILDAGSRRNSPPSQEVLQRMLAQGVLAEETDSVGYHIPIPSMESYLFNKAVRYARIQPGIIRRMLRNVCQVLLDRREMVIEPQDLLDGYWGESSRTPTRLPQRSFGKGDDGPGL